MSGQLIMDDANRIEADAAASKTHVTLAGAQHGFLQQSTWYTSVWQIRRQTLRAICFQRTSACCWAKVMLSAATAASTLLLAAAMDMFSLSRALFSRCKQLQMSAVELGIVHWHSFCYQVLLH